MDIFIEKIVARKKSAQDRLLTTGLVIAGAVLFFITQSVAALKGLSLFIMVGIAYGVFYLSTSRNIEFEYSVTNDEMDIDKIISRRKRKRIFSASCKDFNVIAKVGSEQYTKEAQMIKNRIETISSFASPDVYFATLTYKGTSTILYFEPSQKMLNAFKAYIPRKLFIDGDSVD